MAPKYGGGTPKCGVCDKAVYAQEKMEAGKLVFHKWCFKCSVCGKAVTLQNYGQEAGVLYCKNDFKDKVVAPNTQAAVLQ